MPENKIFEDYVRQIDADTLTPVVQSMLQKQNLVLPGWTQTVLTEGAGGGVFNSALYRFSGTAEIPGDRSISWSVVLKMIRKLDDATPSSSHYWRREFDAYQSGWLSSLQAGNFGAPTCYVSDIFENQLACLWLEDLQDADTDWSIEKLSMVARHLGQFNGRYLTPEAVPDYPWFSKNWIRGDVDTASQFLNLLERADDNPSLALIINETRKAHCQKMYREREIFLQVLDNLPKTIQHLDAFSNNLFIVNRGEQYQTIGIDWAFVGLESIGAELVSLFWVTLFFGDLDASEIVDFEKATFDSYLAGLRDVNWKGDRDLVRLGFTSAVGLRHFGTMMYVMSDFVNSDSDAEREYPAGQLILAGNHIDSLTEEARQLINKLY